MTVRCILFDLDGTRVDSETRGKQALVDRSPAAGLAGNAR
jgi:beta-phosphoglucomutase-like phosphatase (HAD superfamily)